MVVQNMSARYQAELSRQVSRYYRLENTANHRLTLVASNSAEDALNGRAERLRMANRKLTEEGALAMVYGNPANRPLVLAALYG
jgi:hypothetical protein